MFREIIILIKHLVAYKFIIMISKLLGCLSWQRKRNNIFLSRTAEDSPLKLYPLLQVCFIYDIKDSGLLKRQFPEKHFADFTSKGVIRKLFIRADNIPSTEEAKLEEQYSSWVSVVINSASLKKLSNQI